MKYFQISKRFIKIPRNVWMWQMPAAVIKRRNSPSWTNQSVQMSFINVTVDSFTCTESKKANTWRRSSLSCPQLLRISCSLVSVNTAAPVNTQIKQWNILYLPHQLYSVCLLHRCLVCLWIRTVPLWLLPADSVFIRWSACLCECYRGSAPAAIVRVIAAPYSLSSSNQEMFNWG